MRPRGPDWTARRNALIADRPRGVTGAATRVSESIRGWGLAEWFVVSQTALPALLMLPGTQALRFPIRMAPFVIPLLIFSWWTLSKRSRLAAHPARRWLVLSLVYLALMIAHPSTDSLVAGIAHVLLYLSVLSPVFWAPDTIRDARHLGRVLTVVLGCNGINAVVGILQVYDPATWMPPELARIQTGSAHFASYYYVGPDQQPVMRPPGLFDNPGAVCGPGMMAGLFGLVFVGARASLLSTAMGGAFAFAGLVAVFLSYVRTAFAIFIVMVIVYVWGLLSQRRHGTATTLSGTAAVVVAVALGAAVMLGGESIVERFMSLFADDPVSVYYQGLRGQQLEWAFTDYLFEYPFGAGLARWGMVNHYFGDASASIWAELQPSAWIVDGGVVLLLTYGLALVATTREGFRALKLDDERLRDWAAAILAVIFGTIMLIFGFTPFSNQVGLQFWFLIGALHGVVGRTGGSPGERVRPR